MYILDGTQDIKSQVKAIREEKHKIYNFNCNQNINEGLRR